MPLVARDHGVRRCPIMPKSARYEVVVLVFL